MADVSNSDFGVSVQDYSYIPGTQDNVLFNALKYTKVSFVVLLLIVIAIYVGIFFLLGNGNNENSSPLKNIFIILLEIVLWVLLIYIIYINIVNYSTSNYDFQTRMENLFSSRLTDLQVNAQTTTDVSSTAVSSTDVSCEATPSSDEEVFHIPNNVHTYEDAIMMCEKYDARLANYDEIEKAYDNGANWCSYGWSKNQLALYPTQKAIYNQLKKIPGHEHDCGRPGINGGYIANPNVKFGVNCYGVKPKPNANDESYMHSLNHTPTIESNKADDDLANSLLAPFNKTLWSRYTDSSTSTTSS